MQYTIENLAPLNGRFLAEHYSLHQSDVDTANSMVERMEALRTNEETPTPRDGDMVILVRDGKVLTDHAHIEHAGTMTFYDMDVLAVCRDASSPFVRPKSGLCEASGGPWFTVSPGELEYVGTAQKRFWTWGHCGACANGGIEFVATVNLWKWESDKVY